MQIAFWSTMHGQTTTTSNLIAISSLIALEYRLKLLVTHNHYERSTLESSLLDRRLLETELTELSDAGIDALSRFIRFNSLDQDNIQGYTTTLIKNRFDLLMGTKNVNKDLYYSDLNTIITTILNSAKEYYDLLCVDVAAGANALSEKIMDNADLVVVNLNQNLSVLDDFFSGKYPNIQEKGYFILSLYDDKSRYNLKNICRRYKIGDNISVIPYCREYADACNEGKALEFMMRNQLASQADYAYPFIEEVRKSAKHILERVGIDTVKKRIGD